MYVKGQTSGIHRNEGVRKLGYMSISEQPSVHATQSGNTVLLVPKNSGATVTYRSGNLSVAVISGTTRSRKENIRIWKEYANVVQAEKKVIFDHVPDIC